jgi:hypothetical protein
MRDDDPIDRYATMAVARWLSEWRLRTGISQRAVARMAGIDQGGLSRIERGLEGRPSGWRLARLLVVLDWLSGGGPPAGPWADLDALRPDRLREGVGPRPPAVVGVRPLLSPSLVADPVSAWTSGWPQEPSPLADDVGLTDDVAAFMDRAAPLTNDAAADG